MTDYSINVVEIAIAMRRLADLVASMGSTAKHEREVARLFAEIKDNAVIGGALAQQLAVELEARQRSPAISGTQEGACQTD